MPLVKNKRTDKIEDGDKYVGRPTKWGNPFSHLSADGTVKVDSREEAVEAYRLWIETQDELLEQLHELKGKNLVCWCSPKECHADILLELSNKKENENEGDRK